MKKSIIPIIILLFLTFSFANTVSAQEGEITVSGTNVGISFSNPVGTEDATTFLQAVMGHMQSIIAYLALLFILIAGVLYIMAGGSEKMVTAAKICFVSALVGFAIAAAAPSFLKEIKGIALKDGNMPTTLEEALTVKEIVLNAASFILSILGILAIIGLVLSGIFFITSLGNSSKTEKAKKALTYSILGIAVAGSAIILIKTIASLITE